MCNDFFQWHRRTKPSAQHVSLTVGVGATLPFPDGRHLFCTQHGTFYPLHYEVVDALWKQWGWPWGLYGSILSCSYFRNYWFFFNFGGCLVKEGNREYCHCPQLVSSISEESAYIVGVGAYIYCLNNVSLESTCQWVCGVDRRCPLLKSIAWLLHYPYVEPDQHGAGLVLAYVPSPGLQEDLWLFTMEQFPSGCKEEHLDGKAM